ncbi:MAG: small, acid-soluble spore protein, H family [Clostridiales bacterium]|jgi:hypothetical protein|nr:small, acid-soluble spore protein, H family [Clostridiales bacterium]
MAPGRAEGIARSPEMANVTYEGKGFITEGVNESRMTAMSPFSICPNQIANTLAGFYGARV